MKNKSNKIFFNLFTGGSTEDSLVYIRRSLKSEEMDHLEGTHFDSSIPHVFITLGASVSIFSLRVCDTLPLEQFSLPSCFSTIFNFLKT